MPHGTMLAAILALIALLLCLPLLQAPAADARKDGDAPDGP